MTENERLTEKRDGQNVIPLRQDGKTKWSLASAGTGESSTQFLYGTHADKLAGDEAIGTIEEFKALKEKNVAKKPRTIVDAMVCPNCSKVYAVPTGNYCMNCG